MSGAIPPPRSGHSACVINGTILIFGGHVSETLQLSQDVYKLDLNTLEWSFVRTTVTFKSFDVLKQNIFPVFPFQGVPPSRRHIHSATVIKNSMYIFGGLGDYGTNDTDVII